MFSLSRILGKENSKMHLKIDQNKDMLILLILQEKMSLKIFLLRLGIYWKMYDAQNFFAICRCQPHISVEVGTGRMQEIDVAEIYT